MSDPTVVEAIQLLQADGYTTDFRIASDGLRCDSCGHTHRPGDLVVESTSRFEGASNPDDQAVVFGVRCAECDVRGVIVAAYGPTASEEEAAVVTALASPPPAR